MKRFSIVALVLIIIIAAGAIYYFTSVYKSPEQLRVERAATEAKLETKRETLAVIEEYLALREQNDPGTQAGVLDALQEKLLAFSEGLIVHAKDDYESFDRAVKAFRTIVTMEIDELSEALSK
jgi:hypothetical protein